MPGDHVFLASYTVEAETEDAAIQRALYAFESAAERSSVGWARLPLQDRIKVWLQDEPTRNESPAPTTRDPKKD